MFNHSDMAEIRSANGQQQIIINQLHSECFHTVSSVQMRSISPKTVIKFLLFARCATRSLLLQWEQFHQTVVVLPQEDEWSLSVMTTNFKKFPAVSNLLSSEIRQLASHCSNLFNGAQDVCSFFGVLTHVCNLSGLSEQGLDVLFSFWAAVRICQPVLQGQKCAKHYETLGFRLCKTGFLMPIRG